LGGEKPGEVFAGKLRFCCQLFDTERFPIARLADSPDRFDGVRFAGIIELTRPLHEEGVTREAGIMGIGHATLFGFCDEGFQGCASRSSFRQGQDGAVQPAQLPAKNGGERAIEVDPGKRPGFRRFVRVVVRAFLRNHGQKSVAGRNRPSAAFPGKNALTGKRVLNNHKLVLSPQMIIPEIAGGIHPLESFCKGCRDFEQIAFTVSHSVIIT